MVYGRCYLSYLTGIIRYLCRKYDTMPTLEDFQNILQSAQQAKVEQSPLYQHAMKEAALQQQQQQQVPPEVQAVFDELKGTQERNAVREKLQQYRNAMEQQTYVGYAAGGKIHIDLSKKGTFTAAASRHGMGVQEFASKVLANKDNYSPAMVKKANFARVFGGRHYDYGGYIVGNVYDITEDEYNRLIQLGYGLEPA